MCKPAQKAAFLFVTMLLCMAAFAGCAAFSNSGASQRGFEESVSSYSADNRASLGDSEADADLETRIEHKIASMTLEQKVAQLFIIEPYMLEELATDDIDPLTRYPVGGFLYLSGDLQTPDQVRAMLSDTQSRSQVAIDLPLFLCVDEEGGTVSRIACSPAFGVEDVGDMQAIGATGDAARARDAAFYVGTYLVDLGFNVDFAPVADLAGEDDEMFWRSFGPDANLTSKMVKAQVDGFTQAGVLCSVKHFPGIGGIAEDSHITGILSHMSADEFRDSPLRPFVAGIEAGVPFVMVSHLCTPDATGNDIPASLSNEWINGVLRDEMQFKGIVIADALNMASVSDRYSQYELGALAIEAGEDMLLNPSDFSSMYQGVLDAVSRGDLPESRIDESVRRVLRAKWAADDS